MSCPPEEERPREASDTYSGERTIVQPGPIKRLDRPDQDLEPNILQRREPHSGIGRESAGVQTGIADADKKTRTGKAHEQVRNTPPAGDWNDTAPDQGPSRRTGPAAPG